MKKFLTPLMISALLICAWVNAEHHEGTLKITHLDLAQLDAAAMSPMGDTPFWTVTSGDDPRSGDAFGFASANGKFGVGMSKYSQIELELRDFPVDEFMYFVEGQLEIIDADGNSKVYGPGDAIVMPKGFNGTWRQLSPIKKISASYAEDPSVFATD